MKKTIGLLLAFLNLSLASMAQKPLSQHVPALANAVAILHGAKFLEKAPLQQLDSLPFVNRMLAALLHNYKTTPHLKDLGIDLKGDMYYFNLQNDSVNYNGLILPIQQLDQFVQVVGKNRKIQKQGDFQQITSANKTAILTWNSSFALLLSASYNQNFWKDSARLKAYGLRYPGYDNYSNTTVDTAPYVSGDTVRAGADSAFPSAGEAVEAVPATIGIGDSVADAAADAVDSVPEVVIAPPVAVMPTDQDYSARDTSALSSDAGVQSYFSYAKRLDSFNQQRDSIIGLWASHKAVQLFRQQDDRQLMQSGFMKNIDKKAAVTLWVPHLGDLYGGSLTPSYMMASLVEQFNAYGSTTLNLYLNSQDITIKHIQQLDPKYGANAGWDKIFDQKLNKQFLKYLDADSLIAYGSMAINTEQYLKLFPKGIASTYSAWGGSLGVQPADFTMISDLFGLLLDEKAIGKVLNGDGMLALTGFEKKKVPYTSYEYDSNYQSKEVTKTKEDIAPELLCMAGTSDRPFLQKTLDYLVKRQFLSVNKGIYSNLDKKKALPFEYHFLLKGNVFFASTSIDQLRRIQEGKPVHPLSKAKQKILRQSHMGLFFSPQKLRLLLASNNLAGSSYREMDTYLRQLGDIEFVSTGIHKDKFTFVYKAETAGHGANSLQYILGLLNNFAK